MGFGLEAGRLVRPLDLLDADLHVIALDDAPILLDHFDLGMLLPENLHRLVELLLRDGPLVLLERDALVLPELEDGLDLHGGREDQRGAVLNLDPFDRRQVHGDRSEPRLLHGLLVILGDERADDVVLDGLRVALFQQGQRRLAGTKAGNMYLASEVRVDVPEPFGDVLSRHFDPDGPFHRAQFGHFEFHR